MTRRIGVIGGLLVLAAIVAAGAAGAQTPATQPEGGREEFSAFAVNMGALTGGGTAQLIITVNRWSTEADKETLLATLRKSGQNALLDQLQRAKSVGTLRTPNTVGYDLRLALQETGKDGNRRILVVTDRPLSFGEAANRPPSIEYPFTVIDMQIPAEGFGKGTMSIAAKIIPAGRTVLVENYDTQPVQLNRIEARKRDR